MSTQYIHYPNGSGGGGGGSGNASVIRVDLYDPVDTSLTVGAPATSPFVVDGVTVTNGMLVLFSNLSSGNNKVYKANIVGSNIFWAVQSNFGGSSSPTAGDLVVVTSGTAFANQTGEFNGTTWLFNYFVRYFNGTDYFEQSAINTTTLTDNTTNGVVFTVAYAGSQNIFVDFSVLRGTAKEAGTIVLTTDGTTVAISEQGASLSPTGVSFSADISGPNLRLLYTTTSTGSGGTIKYNLRRWSDTAGGPGGPPSYSGGASSTPAAGADGDIQINASGVLGANTNFSYDAINNVLSLGGLEISNLKSVSILDNQASPTLLFSMPVSYSAASIEFSVSRNVNFRTGRLLISTDGVSSSSSESDFEEVGDAGIALTTSVSGSNLNVNYTSTSTGFGGTFKYFFKRWVA